MNELPSYVNCEDEDYELFCANGMTLLSDRMLATSLIRMVEWYTEDGELLQRDGQYKILSRVALADFSCSETQFNFGREWSYQEEIEQFVEDGGKHVILMGHSHGGAEMARLLATDPSFENDVTCPLFISLDATDEAGPVQQVSSRAEKLLNFYQEANWWIDYQRGSYIEGVDDSEQHDMSGFLKHVTFDRSTFIHDRVMEIMTSAIQQLRRTVRDQ